MKMQVTARDPYMPGQVIQLVGLPKKDGGRAVRAPHIVGLGGWGLAYIANRYGSPCEAWNHFVIKNWY